MGGPKLLASMAMAVAGSAIALAWLTPASAFLAPQVFSSVSIQAGAVRRASSCRGMSMKVDNVAAILLAGGVGKRMEADRPKQFLELQGKSVLQHSLDLFLSLHGISQLVLVLDKEYRDGFEDLRKSEKRLVFADPGKERQDSVYNALQKVDPEASLVCIHDAARPLVTKSCVRKVISDAEEHGAAVLGVPMKATVKESEDGEFVLRTIDRSRLWDIQTPQVVKPDILRTGFEKVQEHGWEVTDDVSIVEQLDLPVKLTEGEYTNLKLTTPEDLVVASQILEARKRDRDFEDDDVPREDMLSFKRANAKWADRPRGAPGISELNLDDEIDLSKMRANANWSDRDHGAPGVSELDLEFEIELSKQRADEKWSDRPRGMPGVSELDLEFERELSKERAEEEWTDKKIV